MIIETERLILRPFLEKDAEDVFEYLNEPAVNCFACMKLNSLEEARKEMLKRESETEYHFAITLKETGKVIGEIDAYPEAGEPHADENAVNDTFSPCWMLNDNYQGKGYAFEAASAFFDYLFRQKGARRIYAYTEDYNTSSQHLCEKLGMRREGMFVEFISFINNEDGSPRYENTIQYAILKREWDSAKDSSHFMGQPAAQSTVNPWESISLSDYESHMSLESVKQLQSLNSIMKNQLEDYDVKSAMILGVAGGNGLENVRAEKYQKLYGIDINESYLESVTHRYKNLADILRCMKIDIINEADKLPQAELVIANLLVEYVGYEAFSAAVVKTEAKYVSCVIQINQSEKEWVSDSPYIHAFDDLDKVHHQMEEDALTKTMESVDYKLIKKSSYGLPNGKGFLRLDYMKQN